jgi:hypothetical protein
MFEIYMVKMQVIINYHFLMEVSMKKQLIRATATAVLATGLTAGFASFAAADNLNVTGPGSQNTVKATTSYTAHVENSNNLGVSNSNDQQSHTGTASADRNTTAEDTTSGSAMNSNDDNQVSATIDNSMSADNAFAAAPMSSEPASLGSIGTSGPDSDNLISSTQKTDVTVDNQNNVKVNNENNQNATSGNASSNENTTAGNTTSGDASNSTSSDVQLMVTN